MSFMSEITRWEQIALVDLHTAGVDIVKLAPYFTECAEFIETLTGNAVLAPITAAAGAAATAVGTVLEAPSVQGAESAAEAVKASL